MHFAILLLITLRVPLALAEDLCKKLATMPEKASACPDTGNQVLSANFPNLAYVVSNELSSKAAGASFFAPTVIYNILKYSAPDRPLIIVPNNEANFKKMIKSLGSKISTDENFKNSEWQEQIVRSNQKSVNWTQDYFIAKFDKTTGLPVLSGIAAYNFDEKRGNKEIRVDPLVRDLNQSCASFSRGRDITADKDFAYPSVLWGGNVMGLPGGSCVHGDDQPKSYAKQYCGEANQVEIQTSWLRLSHVDEVFAIVRKPKDEKCNFVATFASPELAISLLEKNPDENFYGFYADDEIKDFSYRFNYVSEETKSSGILEVCKWVHGKAIDCEGIKNGQVAKALRKNTKGMGKANAAIQEIMNDAKTKIKAEILASTGCDVATIDIPQLFWGQNPRIGRKKIYLPPHKYLSVMPNGTNNLSLSQAVLTPHPQNEAWARYIDQVYSEQGIKNVFVDTFDYAHVVDGNLHCATHAIPVCNPL